MEHLSEKHREMLLEYYQEDRHERTERRKLLAQRHGLDINALRIRLHRIRSVVAECTAAGLQRRNEEQVTLPRLVPLRNLRASPVNCRTSH